MILPFQIVTVKILVKDYTKMGVQMLFVTVSGSLHMLKASLDPLNSVRVLNTEFHPDRIRLSRKNRIQI